MINLLRYPVFRLLNQLLDALIRLLHQLLDVANGRLVVSLGLEWPLGGLVNLWTDRIDTLLNERFGFAGDRIHSTVLAICLHEFIIWLHLEKNLVFFPVDYFSSLL